MSKDRKYRIIYNCDCTEAFRRYPSPLTADQLGMVVDEVAGRQVDAYCWSPNAGDMIVFYRSRVAEIYGADVPPDTDIYTETLQSLFRQDLDPMEITSRRVREKGMDFFASVRMNDVHHKSDQEGLLASRFWRKHPEYRLWELTACGNYFNASLDFSYPAVRKRRLAVIEELVGNYDVDGIEIDFGRCPNLFNPSEAWAKRGIATGFMKDVRSLVQRAGKRKGRPLKIIVRTPFYPSGDRHIRYEFGADGIDLVTWMEESLADIFVLSPLRGNDYNLSIREWKKVARSSGVLLYPGIEAWLLFNAPAQNHGSFGIYSSPAEIRGMAQNYLAQEPDGIYFFNYPCLLTPALFSSPRLYREYLSVLGEAGTSTGLAGKNKTYLFYERCPVELEVGRPAEYHQTVPFTVRKPEAAQNRGPWEIEFKITGFPDRKTFQVLLNGKKLAQDLVSWRRDWAGIKPGGIVVNDLRSGYNLGPYYEVVTVRPPAGWIADGANTVGFFLGKGPLVEHSYIKVYELEVRNVPS